MNPILEQLMLLVFLVYTSIRAIFLTFVPTSWRSKKVSGQICFVSGAGSGIGRQIAKQFSALGCKMVLVDINKDWLTQAADECKSAGAQSVNTFVCDLSDRQKVYDTAEKIKTEVGPVDILVNNAGIVSGKALLELDDAANIDRTFKINSICHFWLVKAFLPDMLRRQVGHIVTIASMAGISCAATKLVDYGASKYAAVGFAETLDIELRCQYKTKAIKQTLVCPYYVASGMFHGISLKNEWLLPYMTPEYVATRIVGAVLTDQPLLILPGWLRIIAVLKYVLPHDFQLQLAETLGTTDSMQTFVGRK